MQGLSSVASLQLSHNSVIVKKFSTKTFYFHAMNNLP